MDILHDNSMRTWVSIGSNHENLIPEYVMSVDLDATKEAAAQLGDNQFADPYRRLFPIDSQAQTWLSAAYFHKSASTGKLPLKPIEREGIAARIKEAASIFGISADVEKIANAIKESLVEKTATDSDNNYGWVIKDAKTGEVLARKYPMFDAQGVKKASEYFAEYRSRYPIEVRREIAGNIVKAAHQYGVPASELRLDVKVEAGQGIPVKSILMDELYERANLCKDAEVAIALANINTLVATASEAELSDGLQELATVIDGFDKVAGLTEHYGKTISMPADIIYSVPMDKAVKFASDAVELHQHVFSAEKLAELPVSVFTDVLGDDFGNAIAKGVKIDAVKLADNLHSLPKPDKVALEQHLVELYK
jgi:hypothetical protein